VSRVTLARLYERLPGYFREADAVAGGVARALLDLIATEADRIGAQIDEMGESWFIETCPDWAVPYLADLLGVPLTHDVRVSDEVTFLVSQRARVANTIRYRRRKGTASVLESFAFDVSGWRTVAVEEFERLITTQHLAHVRTRMPNTVDIRAGENLEATPGPFALQAHTVDVRNVALDHPLPAQRPNVANVSLHSYRIDGLLVPLATAQEADAPGRYRIDLLGRDVALVNPPVHDPGVDVRTTEDEVPAPLRRRRLREQLDARRAALAAGRADPAPRWTSRPPFQVFIVPQVGDEPVAIDATDVEVCHLDPWKDPSPTGRIRLDPVAGRVVVPPPFPHRLLVTASSGGVPGVGAGPAPRPATRDELATAGVDWQLGVSRDVAPVADEIVASLADAVTAWNSQPAGTVGVIALMENDRHDVDLTGANRIVVPEGSRLTIVAAGWPELPVVGGAPGEVDRRLGAVTPERLQPAVVGDVEVRGTASATSEDPGSLTIDGIVLSGSVLVSGSAQQQLGRLRLRTCTQLVGGVSTTGNRSLLAVEIRTSRVGPIRLGRSVSDLSIVHSVVDGDGGDAIGADGARVELNAVTTIGRCDVRELHASGCLLDGRVEATLRQQGCVRYSYVEPSSTTPRRYRCIDAPVPAFVSTDRGGRGYAVLADSAGAALRTAGELSDELGAFGLVRATHREQNTTIALSEYRRVGIEAGVVRVM
jgi:hypothetical protein